MPNCPEWVSLFSLLLSVCRSATHPVRKCRCAQLLTLDGRPLELRNKASVSRVFRSWIFRQSPRNNARQCPKLPASRFSRARLSNSRRGPCVFEISRTEYMARFLLGSRVHKRDRISRILPYVFIPVDTSAEKLGLLTNVSDPSGFSHSYTQDVACRVRVTLEYPIIMYAGI